MKSDRRRGLPRIAAAAAAVFLLASLPAVGVAAAEEYDTAGATRLTFTDGGITAADGKYTDYVIDGTALQVEGAGTYILSGTCGDGSVTVKKGTIGVTLVLDGLTLTSAATAPLACNKSTGVTVMAAAGSVNTLTDTARNNDEVYPDNELAENAVIKCKDGSQVTLCGSGTLIVNANGKNGIKSGATTDAEGEAWLHIRDLTLEVTASVNDGIAAEAAMSITGGTITVRAADDGIHSDYTLTVGEPGTDGPTIRVTQSNEGLEAAELTIHSGDISVRAKDDGLNAANGDLTGYTFSMTVTGGTLRVYSETGDGLDANGNLTISGGTVTVFTASGTAEQPLDADGTITISGGTVFAAGGSAGTGMKLNTAQPYVLYGSSGRGNMGSMGGMGGRPGQDMQNGQDNQNGMPENRPELGNGAGMKNPANGQEAPPDMNGTPGQQAWGGRFDQGTAAGTGVSIDAGSAVTIRDASGGEVYRAEAPCRLTTVFYCDAGLVSGQNYTLLADGSETATTAAAAGQSSVLDGNGERPGLPAENGGSRMSVVLCLVIAGAALLIAAACGTALIVLLRRQKKRRAASAAPAVGGDGAPEPAIGQEPADSREPGDRQEPPAAP